MNLTPTLFRSSFILIFSNWCVFNEDGHFKTIFGLPRIVNFNGSQGQESKNKTSLKLFFSAGSFTFYCFVAVVNHSLVPSIVLYAHKADFGDLASFLSRIFVERRVLMCFRATNQFPL